MNFLGNSLISHCSHPHLFGLLSVVARFQSVQPDHCGWSLWLVLQRNVRAWIILVCINTHTCTLSCQPSTIAGSVSAAAAAAGRAHSDVISVRVCVCRCVLCHPGWASQRKRKPLPKRPSVSQRKPRKLQRQKQSVTRPGLACSRARMLLWCKPRVQTMLASLSSCVDRA